MARLRRQPCAVSWLQLVSSHPKGLAFDALACWLPTIDFTWRITAGPLVTATVVLIFRTPPERVRSSEKAVRNGVSL
jgi:hypothetical protein